MRLLPILVLLLLSGVSRPGFAQDSPRPVGPDFRFPDGLYLSHAALLALRPDAPLGEIGGEMVRLDADRTLKIADYAGPENRRPYAVVVAGLPYLNVAGPRDGDFLTFAGLQQLGALSHMSYDTTVQTRTLMRAYNPVNGRPFREGWVERDRTRRLERILDLRSGQRYPFDLATVRRLCADDRDLRAALDRAQPTETDKLRRALRIHSARYPLSLPLFVLNR